MSKIEVKDREFLWVERYRPTKIQDTILSDGYKKTFQKFVDDGNIPNLLLSGGPGIGKTTVARAMLDEIGADYLFINGSLKGGIDTLRMEIRNFASSMSLMGGRKYVILDEADYLTQNAQTAFRGVVEEFSKNCGFILTCNFANRIIGPIRESRFKVINFTYNEKEKLAMQANFFKRVCSILENEDVPYDKKVVAKLMQTYFPDFRKIINELQTYSASGNIDEGIFRNMDKESVSLLFSHLKNKEFAEARKWVASNSDQDTNEIFRSLYDEYPNRVKKESQPDFIVTLGEYSYKNALVANPEINLMAFITTVMFECEYV